YHNTIVPHLSENSTVPPEILQFDYSFGYNCKKLSNLCLIDRNVLVFASGNLIHFLNISKVTVTVRRSEGGVGIGSIAKLSNLCLIDRNVLVFASGNLIHFLNISKVTVTVRRSEGGVGIGSIADHQGFSFFQ
uniref:Uncharacterized protein n=1 Tax=Lutzomyia longipalpis TaxID=7200 RepID=A0A1B0CQZ2_LUTLO